MQRLVVQSPMLTIESARQLVEKDHDQRDSRALRERPAYKQLLLIIPNVFWIQLFLPRPEPEVPDPEVFEHQTARDLAAAGEPR